MFVVFCFWDLSFVREFMVLDMNIVGSTHILHAIVFPLVISSFFHLLTSLRLLLSSTRVFQQGRRTLAHLDHNKNINNLFSFFTLRCDIYTPTLILTTIRYTLFCFYVIDDENPIYLRFSGWASCNKIHCKSRSPAFNLINLKGNARSLA